MLQNAKLSKTVATLYLRCGEKMKETMFLQLLYIPSNIKTFRTLSDKTVSDINRHNIST